MARWRPAWTGVVAAGLVVVSGCGPGAGASPPVEPGAPVPVVEGAVPTPDHVMLVVFENEDEQQVVGSAAAPYLTSLAGTGANFTNAHAETHPSQPNYLALFSGSTHGVTDDSCPLSLEGDNLAAQLIAAGRTFVGFSEGLPQEGATACSADGYRRKHNPWVDFASLPEKINQPYAALPEDYADLPTVSFVVPNMCHDMHDCDTAAGDRWARTELAPYVAWARTHNSLLAVTCDESDGGDDDNRIPTFLVGPMVQPGDSAQLIDHLSILRTIEEMYGLPPLAGAENRQPIHGVWTPSAG